MYYSMFSNCSVKISNCVRIYFLRPSSCRFYRQREKPTTRTWYLLVLLQNKMARDLSQALSHRQDKPLHCLTTPAGGIGWSILYPWDRDINPLRHRMSPLDLIFISEEVCVSLALFCPTFRTRALLVITFKLGMTSLAGSATLILWALSFPHIPLNTGTYCSSVIQIVQNGANMFCC